MILVILHETKWSVARPASVAGQEQHKMASVKTSVGDFLLVMYERLQHGAGLPREWAESRVHRSHCWKVMVN